MPAYVEERADRTGRGPDGQNRPAVDLVGHEIAGLGQLPAVAQQERPVAEHPGQFRLEAVPVEIAIGRHGQLGRCTVGGALLDVGQDAFDQAVSDVGVHGRLNSIVQSGANRPPPRSAR